MPRREHRASDQRRRPQDIAACRNAAIEECEGGPRLLTRAFRNVAEAQGGVSEIARRADIDRVDVPRGLSAKTDPGLGTVAKIAPACRVWPRFVAAIG